MKSRTRLQIKQDAKNSVDRNKLAELATVAARSFSSAEELDRYITDFNRVPPSDSDQSIHEELVAIKNDAAHYPKKATVGLIQAIIQHANVYENALSVIPTDSIEVQEMFGRHTRMNHSTLKRFFIKLLENFSIHIPTKRELNVLLGTLRNPIAKRELFEFVVAKINETMLELEQAKAVLDQINEVYYDYNDYPDFAEQHLRVAYKQLQLKIDNPDKRTYIVEMFNHCVESREEDSIVVEENLDNNLPPNSAIRNRM